MPKTRTSRSTRTLCESFTKTKSRCRLALKKSKPYWALIACCHCREYTSCRSAFACYSKVAHNNEVMLVDGREARDKVGILSEGQPGFPSTKGRELGDIVKLDYRLVEAGVVCTVGCKECAGLPLGECIDAGHYQQERLTEDLPAVARRRVKAKPRSGPRLSAAPKTAKRGKGGDDSNGSAGEQPSRSKRVRSGGCVSPREEDMTGDDPVPLKECRAEGRSDHRSDVVSQGSRESREDNGHDSVASLAGGELPPVSSCLEDPEVPVDTTEGGACAVKAEGTRVPVVDSAVCASSEDAVTARDPARPLLLSAPGCSSVFSASALNEANGTHVKPSDEWSAYFNIDNLRASAMEKFRKAQRVELNEEKAKCREELAPLEKALEELKVKLRGRMKNVLERQAREVQIFHSVLYGSTVPMTL